MEKKDMKKAFTMIELVFVIVIIGILTAVAVPKLTANRDDALAKVCTQEASQLLQELLYYYAKNTYFDAIENMSNLNVGINGTENNGIKEGAGTVPSFTQAVTYTCYGEDIVTYIPMQSTYTDTKGKVHDQFGIVTTDPGGQTTVQAKIAVTDLAHSSFYKANPGYVIGGN
jgi:prepilin-type N-terminal cleavage/methylation domain-containing protein